MKKFQEVIGMKKLILIILLVGMIVSCSDDNPNLPSNFDESNVVNVYCQATPTTVLSRIENYYNNGNLTIKKTYSEGNLESTTTFEYNSSNLLSLEICEAGLSKYEKTYIYNALNQLINIIHKIISYDNQGHIISESESETPLKYENNQLVKEWVYCGGFTTYEYENGKVSAKIDYSDTGQKGQITTYKYSGDLKIEERKVTAAGSLMYVRTFQYNSENQLITIIEDGNIIETNFYNQNKLTEKRTYYFGIDPGFYLCDGNFIYRYEY